jgi:hypothetical protein
LFVDNPKLGASNNLVAHNLFIVQVNDRQAIGVTNSSTGNQFKNNVVVAVSISGGKVFRTSQDVGGGDCARHPMTALVREHYLWSKEGRGTGADLLEPVPPPNEEGYGRQQTSCVHSQRLSCAL